MFFCLFVSEICLFDFRKPFTHRSDIFPFKLLHVLKQPRDRRRPNKGTLNLALPVQITCPTQAKSNSPLPWWPFRWASWLGRGGGGGGGWKRLVPFSYFKRNGRSMVCESNIIAMPNPQDYSFFIVRKPKFNECATIDRRWWYDWLMECFTLTQSFLAFPAFPCLESAEKLGKQKLFHTDTVIPGFPDRQNPGAFRKSQA